MIFKFGINLLITNLSLLASYPFETIRYRMMMTSLEKVHYQNFIDCGRQIYFNEGIKPFFGGTSYIFMKGISGSLFLTIYGDYLKKTKDNY